MSPSLPPDCEDSPDHGGHLPREHHRGLHRHHGRQPGQDRDTGTGQTDQQPGLYRGGQVGYRHSVCELSCHMHLITPINIVLLDKLI